MINLIPQHARKQVKIEYWVRVVSVWLLLLSFSFVIMGTLLIPSIILTRAQLYAYDAVYQDASDKNQVYTALEKEITVANTVAMKLASVGGNTLFTELISEVRDIAKNTVTLESVSLERIEGEVSSIKISGISSTRAALVQFREDLEKNPYFESADLPLSNLAKDKEVPFSITIITSNEIYK